MKKYIAVLCSRSEFSLEQLQKLELAGTPSEFGMYRDLFIAIIDLGGILDYKGPSLVITRLDPG